MSNKHTPTELQGVLFLLATALIGGISGTWIKFLSSDFTMYEQIYVRCTMAIIFISVFVISREIYLNGLKSTYKKYRKFINELNWKKIKNPSAIKLYCMSALVPLAGLTYMTSVLEGKIAITTFSFFAGNFLIGSLIAVYVFNDKMNPSRWTALILALIGIAVFANPFSSGGISHTVLLGLISGLIGAVINGFKKSLGHKINLVAIMIIPLTVMAMTCFILGSFERSAIIAIQSASNIAILFSVLFAIVISTTEFFVLKGLRLVNMHSGNIILSTNIFFSALFAQLILHENLQMNEIAGGGLILAAVITPTIYQMATRPTPFDKLKYIFGRRRNEVEIILVPTK